MPKRKICFVTGSRADYGLLHWLMKAVAADEDLELQLIVTGSHLNSHYGETVREIERDGFTIDARVPILVDDDDTRIATAQAMARALDGVARELARLAPDFTVVLGDRYEILAAVEAAVVLDIPVIHIHGGEITEGAMDDAFRHAITKLAYFHLVAAEPYRERIIQMGEHPDRVVVVGAAGVESVRRFEPLGESDIVHLLGPSRTDPLFLVTYHPVTAAGMTGNRGIEELVAALSRFQDARIVITGVNADPGHEYIKTTLGEFARANCDRVTLHESLGMRRYLSVMSRASAVIGNSSSGILEAPALGIPTVDIGSRQSGRIKAQSVVECGETAPDIAAAIQKAMSPEFRAMASSQTHPYGDGKTSERMLAAIRSVCAQSIVPKHFHDLAIR